MSPSSGHDTPAPLDNDEPPPRKRGLGRGLADLTRAGSSVGVDGELYYGLDALNWTLDRAHSRRAAERTPQPKALGRLPKPVETGPLQVADILAARSSDVPKQRSLRESINILNARLEHPTEAIQVREADQEVAIADVVEELSETPPAPQPTAAPARVSKYSWLEDDD